MSEQPDRTDPPERQASGSVFTQNITAAGGATVNAVQHGDQYLYIYRGSPPYRIEPFEPVDQADPLHGLARVPSRLLSARHQVVPYLPRPELAILEAWRDDLQPRLSVRLVHAEGGQGKTRLAAEFARRSAQAGWAVANARHRSEVAAAGGGDRQLTVRPPGLVLLVDYAERWPLEDLITLVRQHQEAARDRVRILLLARPAGGWWQNLAHQFAKNEIFDVQALRLEPLADDAAERTAMYVAARDRFAQILAVADAHRIAPPARLRDPAFALTLTVHMRALVDVDAAAHGRTAPDGNGQAQLSSYLLDREHDYWRSTHDEGRGPVRTAAQAMGRAVYLATLTRPLTVTAAATALARTGFVETTDGGGRQVIEDHARCYPPEEPGLVFEPLYPDRLGEDFLALTIPGHEDEFAYYATDPWSTSAPTALLAPQTDLAGHPDPPAYTRQALSVLIEAALRWPHLAAGQLVPLLRAHPALALRAGNAALTRLADVPDLAVDVLDAIAAVLPPHDIDLDLGAAALMQRLTDHKLTTIADPAARAKLYVDLSLRYGNAGLYGPALEPAEEALAILRPLADSEPDRHLRSLAFALGNLSGQLGHVGRPEQALALAQEALEIRRRLAESPSELSQANLAAAMTNLGQRLADSGRRAEALALTEESIPIHRRLAEKNPGKFLPNLATALANLGGQLSRMGRLPEALEYEAEAVNARRRQAEANPNAYLPDLAGALANLGALQWRANHTQEALACTHEAVAIRRRLAEINPDAYLPGLAAALLNLGTQLAAAGRTRDALTPTREMVDIYRALAEAYPARHRPQLAFALRNLGTLLSTAGHKQLAAAPSEEAVDLYRDLAGTLPAVYLPELAAAVSSLATRLIEAGRSQDALKPGKEAVDLYRILAGALPAAHLTGLASGLHVYGTVLSRAGRPHEALECTTEAAQIRRRLAAQDPDENLPSLAKSLINLSEQLSSVGRRSEAQAPILEAVTILRSLAEAEPDAHMTMLASALVAASSQLSIDPGRLAEAVSPAEEAVAIYRRLAEADPDAREPHLAFALSGLASRYSRLGRAEEAIELTKEEVAIRRRLVQRHPGADLAELAAALSNLGVRLGKLPGGKEHSLAPEQEALEIRRRLTAADPATHLPKLATALNNISSTNFALRRKPEALAQSEEALEIRRRLAAADPASFLSELAVSLANTGIMLYWADRGPEALATTREAVEIRRRLAADDPATRIAELANALIAFVRVRINTRQELPDALAAAEEAITILTPLAERLPDAFGNALHGAEDARSSVSERIFGRAQPPPQPRRRMFPRSSRP